ncbi:MAG TPA: DNA-3-methyladenine glycosylase [Planctomycetaceae bacterium]|nr:DNA-3-methyladenine glycosylase [Planctomycetaceae bacterium]
MTLITQEFCDRPVEQVARALIGATLCRRSREGLTSGVIVETEAYLPEGDSAAHSFIGPNRKNASMFGPPCRAYVYTIHARQCVNVVTEAQGIGCAVLIRALEPLGGRALMEVRRGTDVLRDLCRGPARLTEALGIGRDLDGWPIDRGTRLWIDIPDDPPAIDVTVTPRIGVTSAEEMPLRFVVAGSSYVSGTRRQNTPIA